MTYTKQYLEKCQQMIETVAAQEKQILEVAKIFADSILAGRMVHVFGSGHSRIMVVGANGQRQAMFLENVSGLAEQIIRNFDVNEQDAALIISSSGCNVVPIEMAEIFKSKGLKVVGLNTKLHSEASTSKRKDGKKLQDFCDVVLDSGAPLGDAMIKIENLETPVAPGSTVGSCMLINSIKAEVANLLTQAGRPPKVLTAGAVVGAEKAAELFQSAYDEHAHRISKMYKSVGIESYVSKEDV
jgi:uncharacterized phosphosugar-binding protein